VRYLGVYFTGFFGKITNGNFPPGFMAFQAPPGISKRG
jgi:hypothetical protein